MLKHMDGFDQFQGQAGNTLLTSLVSLGYTPAPGMAIAAGRHPGTYALELQVTAGSSGLSWSSRPNSLTRALSGVCHTGTKWVAVGASGLAATSDDSQSWVPVVTGITGNLTRCAAGNDRVIAVGPTGLIAVSPDGQAWAQVPLIRPGIVLVDITFAEGVFIMVGQEGSQGVIFRTTDGTDIEQVAQNIPNPMLCVGFGNGKFMVGGGNGVLRVSTDATGSLWDAKALQSGSTVSTLAHGENGTWLAGQGRTVYRTLNDGSNWVVAVADAVPQGTIIDKIRYSSGLWVLQSSANRIYTSGDPLGESFTQRFLAGNNVTLRDVNFSTGAMGGWVTVGSAGGSTTPAFIGVSVSPPTRLGRTFNSQASRVVIGFAHRATARGQIMRVAGLFDMDWPRGISILGQEGNAVPIRNVWYYYEIVIDKTAGQLQLYINDYLDLTVPLPAAAATMFDYPIEWIAENGAVARIDDIVIIDSDATDNSEILNRIGPVQIPLLPPTEDATSEFEVVPPGMDHWQAVGSLPPSLSSFIRSSTSGAKDTFRSSAPLPDGAGTPEVPIFAVSLLALAQKSDLDDRQLGLVIGEGADEVEIIDAELSTTPEYSIGIFERAPANAPWDETNIDGLVFGVAVRP